MQYALMEIDENRKVIIDAEELNSLDNYRQGNRLQDFEPEDHTLALKVVYGQFIPQPYMDFEEVRTKIIASKGLALGHIYKGVCHLLVLVDITLESPLKNNYIPFAALISTDLPLEPTPDKAISAFLRYGNMIPEDNILNRIGIFSITRMEFLTNNLTQENWRVFVDKGKIPSETPRCHHERSVSRVDKVVEELKYVESIKDEENHTFVLTHTYDREPRLFFITGPYTADTMNALIAYIQYECSEIDESYGMDQTEVIEVLKKFYDCSEADVTIDGVTEIDLYINW